MISTATGDFSRQVYGKTVNVTVNQFLELNAEVYPKARASYDEE